MPNEYGLKKLERIYQTKVVPGTIRTLMKVFGVEVDIYRVKNKKIKNTIVPAKRLNKFSRDVYQNNGILALGVDETEEIIDTNQNDYINNSDKISTQYVLITTQTFEDFNGIIAGLNDAANLYCLTFDFHKNDIVEVKTEEGIKKRYKITDIMAIGDTKVLMKKYIITSLAI